MEKRRIFAEKYFKEHPHFFDTSTSENEQIEILIQTFERQNNAKNRVLNRINKPKKQTISLQMNYETLAKFRQFAEKNGLKYQTLINATLDEFAETLD